MKKFNIVLMSVLTLVLSSVLAACTFKKADASFSSNEIVVSTQESINLDQYLNVSGIAKSDVVYRFSNPDIFETSERQAKAIQSGKSFVYATFQNNNLASMQIVVRKAFEAPKEFSLSETGLLSWNVVSDFYENESVPTNASSYLVQGSCLSFDEASGENVETEIFEQVFENNFQFQNSGTYNLSITAQGAGYFDNSPSSETKTFYFGYMPKLSQSDLTWDNLSASLSWSPVSGAKYKVKMDGLLFDDFQETNFKSLKELFDNSSAGTHALSVVVYDDAGDKISQESEVVEIVKLDVPEAKYSFSLSLGGEVVVSTSNEVEKYQFIFTNVDTQGKKTIVFDNVDDILSTSFADLEEGVYDLNIVSINENGRFYQSDALNFGKVYKMGDITLSGNGENVENGTKFNAKIDSVVGVVSAKTNILGLDGIVQVDGISIGETTKAFEIQIPNAGKFNLAVQQIPGLEANTIDGEEVFVLNSNLSGQIEIVKLPEFQTGETNAIAHTVVENKSVLTFKEIEGATKYDLFVETEQNFVLVEQSLFQISVLDGEVEILFDGKIEDLFEANSNIFQFKVVAKTENDNLTINSSSIKTITLLSAPISAGSGNSTNKTYEWNESNNANGYKLEIYQIDKTVYQANKDVINIDTSDMAPVVVDVESAQYTFENEGYYYVKIFATSNNVDQYISSIDCLQEVFFIAEKLQNGTVEFGFDEAYKNQNGFTQSSGYFLKVANSENVNRYEISVVGGEGGTYKVSNQGENIYLLAENFARENEEISINVVGHAADETLYVASDITSISVERLRKIGYGDLKIDELTSKITIQPKAGVSGIKIWQDDGNYVVSNDGNDAVFDIKKLSTFSLKFDLYGTKAQNNLFVCENGKVYLDSESSTLNFSRLQAPSDLRYYNQNLTFEHLAVGSVDYYVLDLICETVNGEQTKFSLRLDDEIEAVFQDQRYKLGQSAGLVSFSGNKVDIKLNEIIELLKASDLAGIYNQSTDIKFSVWGYQDRSSGDNVVLSSPSATIFGDSSQTQLKIEKMSSTKLSMSYSETDFVFAWDGVDASASVAAETTYQVFKDNEIFGDAINSGLSYSFSKSVLSYAQFYEFFVKVSNPYYLESNNSNIVKIYKLRPIPKVTLADNGTFTYEIYTSEKDFCKTVEITNSEGMSENTNGVVEISTSGNYSLKVKGKTIENLDSTIYYVDSESSSFALTEMEVVKPSNSVVNFNNNLLSWDAFAEEKTLSSLVYVVMFKDLNGGLVKHVTKETSANLATNVELYNAVSALQAGEISVWVSAHLENYSVQAGGTVYYSAATTLLDGNQEFNHWLYQSENKIKKLSTPQIEKVEFVYEGLENSQFPDIKITFAGNYGDLGKFNVFLNENLTKTLDINAVDSKYSFVLTKQDYNNALGAGETLTVEIAALSDVDIPSSAGSVDIVRALELKKVGLETLNSMSNHQLVVEFDASNLNVAVGGIVLKLDYQPSGQDVVTEYKVISVDSLVEIFKYDLSEFFKEKLADGGTLKVSAFVNNFANDADKKYYLAPPSTTESETYDVLNQVSQVSKRAGGFLIDESINSNATKYIVEYGASRFEVGKEEGFYFEFPNTWANGSFDLKIYATQEGFVNSVSNTINFVLNRIEKVSSVEMKRQAGDLSAVSLTWNAVSGASKYLVRMYKQTDIDKQNVLFEFEGENTSYTLIEIFGRDYQKLLEFGKVSAFDLLRDFEVLFEIVAVGDESVNNSHAFEFLATLKGNNLQTEGISVDEFGRIVFNSEVGTEYLYRFVSADGAELQPWKSLVANSTSTKLETKNLMSGTLFNVEIIAVGSAVDEPASSADSNFVLDSITTTTYGNDLTFVLNEEIVKVGYNESLPSYLSYTMVANSFTKLYAGLTEDAINTEDLIEFVPIDILPDENDSNYIYIYNFYDIIEKFREKNIKINTSASDTTIYFWSYRTTESVSGSYVVSKSYKYVFKFVEEDQFVEIKKMGKIEGNPNFNEDDANTFALFNNNDVENVLQTLGIFVKVTQIEGGSDQNELFVVRKFVPKPYLLNTEYFYDTNLFALNLTEIFENDDLLYLNGKFKVEFAKVQIEISANADGSKNYKHVITDWISEWNSKEFVFTRLPEVKSLTLSSGNLYWTRNGEDTTKYYVYFIQDLDGEKLGTNYNYFSTTNTYYNASDFVAAKDLYYLAVQSISEDPYMISSKRTFIIDLKDTEKKPIPIYKNQMNSKLVLKNGKLSLDWDTNGDFYKCITSGLPFAEIAEKLGTEVFTSPFTFTLKQLVDNQIFLRIRFTSLNSGVEGIRRSVDVNAKYLLSDFYNFGNDNNFDLKTRLGEIYANSGSSTTTIRNTIFKFIELVENGSFGIANFKTLFDDCFEAIQTGSYKLEYSLVGNDRTLNSTWYSFENLNNENVLYVNEEPTVKATKSQDENDRAINNYKIIIKKSKIWNFVGGQYVQEKAENYVLKIYTSVGYKAFAITKSGSRFSLSLLESDLGTTVSVYETNSAGEETADGDYLMVYINFNGGNSILGVFGDLIEKTTYQMQIYAVGNDFSASSKSENFSLILLGFGNSFAINDGVFSWTPHANRNTSVIFKKNTSSAESLLEVDGSMAQSRFSLDDLGNGLYDYIKFVTFGEVRNKVILVDSEIYQIDNAYKLAAPSLSNDFGYVGIDDSKNVSMLENCYSDSNLFNYMMYNNISTADSYIKFSDDNNASKILYYEAGTTNIDENNSDFIYKKTEEKASTFFVSSLGTTAGVKIEEDAENYYLRRILCLDLATNEMTTKSIAVRSQFTSFEASMLDKTENLHIENGILNWDAVLGRTEGNLQISSPAEIVYKITLAQYKISNTGNGEVDTNVGQEYYYYTTKTNFDFSMVEEDKFVSSDEPTYLKVIVQALAMNITQREPSGKHVSLIEGGYAFGNVLFESSTNYVLMGEGSELKRIDRLAPIDEGSLEVVDGSVCWKYTTKSNVVEENFFDHYSFVVLGKDDRVIDGQFAITLFETSASQNTFKVKFLENSGAMDVGTHTLKVFATQGSRNSDIVIKSFAREIEITKLQTIKSEDFEIVSDSLTETLDLSKYFADSNVNNIVVNIQIVNGQEKTEKTLQFDKSKFMMYILRDDADIVNLPNPKPVGYIDDYLVVKTDFVAKMTFKVNNNLANVVYSDLSEEILLQRSSWGENGEISWDNENQVFNWVYDGHFSLSQQVLAEKVEYVDVLIADATLFNDETMIDTSEIILSKGQQISVEQILENCARISFEGNQYYINISSFERQLTSLGEETLQTTESFKIVEEIAENSVILLDNGNMFRVSTDLIVKPVYIVEATYGDAPNQIVRTYQTTQTTFVPTIVGKVRLSIRIKLGTSNIQSTELVYIRDNGNGENIDYADFNLFESGQGTAVSPYVINTVEQFKNMQKRMEKPDYLYKFVENNRVVNESEQYYFSINSDLTLSQADNVGTYLNGVLFKGDFHGIVEGNNHTIAYISKGVSTLSKNITVAVGNVLGPGNEVSMTFRQGTSLFETMSASSAISNLNLDVSYADATIPNHSLMAGLVLSNNGKIDNVNLVNFKNAFIGYRAPNERTMMIYSGIASINIGGVASISNCKVQTNMEINDSNFSQLIFVSGIVYTNYAVVENCVVGQNESSNFEIKIVCNKPTDTIQVAGIAVTNNSSATIKNCTNNFDILVEGTNSTNQIVVYIAGIADLGTGTMTSNVNNGNLNTINIGVGYLYKGDIAATTR